MRVALFKSMTYGHESVWDEESEQHLEGYVRTSEYVEVEFPPLADDRIVKQQIDQLDKLAEKKTAEYRREMTKIDDHKKRLLAITHQPEEA